MKTRIEMKESRENKTKNNNKAEEKREAIHIHKHTT